MRLLSLEAQRLALNGCPQDVGRPPFGPGVRKFLDGQIKARDRLR
jgi:hypothetical protein